MNDEPRDNSIAADNDATTAKEALGTAGQADELRGPAPIPARLAAPAAWWDRFRDIYAGLTAVRDWALALGALGAVIIWQFPQAYELWVRNTRVAHWYFLEVLSLPPDFTSLQRQVYVHDDVTSGGGTNLDFFITIAEKNPTIYPSGANIIPGRSFDANVDPANAFAKTIAGVEFAPGRCLFAEDVLLRPYTVPYEKEDDGNPVFATEQPDYQDDALVSLPLSQIKQHPEYAAASRLESGDHNAAVKALLRASFRGGLSACHSVDTSPTNPDTRPACRLQVRVKGTVAACD